MGRKRDTKQPAMKTVYGEMIHIVPPRFPCNPQDSWRSSDGAGNSLNGTATLSPFIRLERAQRFGRCNFVQDWHVFELQSTEPRMKKGTSLITFGYSAAIKHRFPELASQVILFDGVTTEADVSGPVREFTRIANVRLAAGSEGEFPEIQAWRRTFAKMGLKPTQYRCAAEALLRRLRKEQNLPAIHPLVDLCNAISVAFAIPIALFDTARVHTHLEVRQAEGTEVYQTFSGETETPEAGEVIFADHAGHAHARRWSNRQSGRSIIRPQTASVLIVAEALHDGAAEDLMRLKAALEHALPDAWPLGRITKFPTA